MKYYEYTDKLIDLILMIANFLLRIQSVFDFNMKKILSNNKTMRTLKRNDACYIIGNGPSLKNVDLHLLKGMDTFTANFFYKHQKDDFVSRYHIILDNRYYETEEGKRYIEEIYQKYPDLIFILKYSFHSSKEWDLNRTFFVSQRQFQIGNKISIDFTKNVSACVDVVEQSIKLAMYMGYKKIYLVGMDFSDYTSLKALHYYQDKLEEGWRDINMGQYTRLVSMAYSHLYALNKFALKNGIEIINLTEGSLIDAFPRQSLESVLYD